MGLLSGLGNLGLGKLENAQLYNEEPKKKTVVTDNKDRIEKPYDENELIFDKSCTCPVCENKFTYRAVKSGKARLMGTDPDLRPKYGKFDPVKYEVIVCTKCGYAALVRFFDSVTAKQAKLVKEQIAGNVRGVKNSGVLSYDDAISRFQLALSSSMVKNGKNSEKAYTCLKMAWCLRGKAENYPKDASDYEDVMEACHMDENEALSMALEGFAKARQSENFPIAGMNEVTLDYLIAELAFELGEIDAASKIVSQLLVNSATGERIKDKCRDLKERIKAEKKGDSNEKNW